PKERKGAKNPPPPPKRIESERRERPEADQDHPMIEAAQHPSGSIASESHQQETHTAEDTAMSEHRTSTDQATANELANASRDRPSSFSEFDPTQAAKKLLRQEGSTDIGHARYSGTDNSNSQRDAFHIPGTDIDKTERTLNPPGHSGTQTSNNL
ncbi:hypothetical protein HMPREF1544_12382, partial [Mucor circinelloides 1006PhL]